MHEKMIQEETARKERKLHVLNKMTIYGEMSKFHVFAYSLDFTLGDACKATSLCNSNLNNAFFRSLGTYN